MLRYEPASGAVMFFDGHALALDDIGLHVALDLEGEHLELVQINFHTPSDFIVEGLQHAAEAHFVHVSNYDGSVVIVVALFDFGSHSPSGFAEALTMVPALAAQPDGRLPLPSFSALKALGDFVDSGSDKDYYVVGGQYVGCCAGSCAVIVTLGAGTRYQGAGLRCDGWSGRGRCRCGRRTCTRSWRCKGLTTRRLSRLLSVCVLTPLPRRHTPPPPPPNSTTKPRPRPSSPPSPPSSPHTWI